MKKKTHELTSYIAEMNCSML